MIRAAVMHHRVSTAPAAGCFEQCLLIGGAFGWFTLLLIQGLSLFLSILWRGMPYGCSSLVLTLLLVCPPAGCLSPFLSPFLLGSLGVHLVVVLSPLVSPVAVDDVSLLAPCCFFLLLRPFWLNSIWPQLLDNTF